MGNVAATLSQPAAADQVDITFVLSPHVLDSQRFRPLAVVHWHSHSSMDYHSLSYQVDVLLASDMYLGQVFVLEANASRCRYYLL